MKEIVSVGAIFNAKSIKPDMHRSYIRVHHNTKFVTHICTHCIYSAGSAFANEMRNTDNLVLRHFKVHNSGISQFIELIQLRGLLNCKIGSNYFYYDYICMQVCDLRNDFACFQFSKYTIQGSVRFLSLICNEVSNMNITTYHIVTCNQSCD